jgi:hypothetical protein
MANQPQVFRQHQITRALKAASRAGMPNPTVEVRLPTGATIFIGSGKPTASDQPPVQSPRKRGRK